ncbi:MAG: hypothetical protein RLZZ324_725 [Candidatus Parcubacteria bacterium]
MTARSYVLKPDYSLWLGSSSRWRRQIMHRLGVPFAVTEADIDEKAIRHPNPTELTRRLAVAKADAILARGTLPPGAVLITADQVISVGGEIREKPEDERQARDWLRAMHERPIGSHVGLCLTILMPHGPQKLACRDTETDFTIVTFKPIPLDVIEAIIAQGEALTCAGALRIEDPLAAPYVKSTMGTWQPGLRMAFEESEATLENTRTSIQGLPIGRLGEMLTEFGIIAPVAQ